MSHVPFRLWQTEEKKVEILQDLRKQAAEFNVTQFPGARQNLSVEKALELASIGKIPPIDVIGVYFYHYLEGAFLREILLLEDHNPMMPQDKAQTIRHRVSKYNPADLLGLQAFSLDVYKRGTTLNKPQLACLLVTWIYAKPVIPKGREVEQMLNLQ